MLPILEPPHAEYFVTEREYEEICAYDARWEVWNGQLHPLYPKGGLEGALTADLSALVTLWTEDHNLGFCFGVETGFRVREEPVTILAPDFAFVTTSRTPRPVPRGFVPVVPDLVLETRSPHGRVSEINAKVALWLEVGARLVWELDPHQRILTVHSAQITPRLLGPDGILDAEPLLPGWTLPLRLIWRD